jgi:DNA ligase (NAD+)
MYKETILSLIEVLNKATEAYDRGEPYMGDSEWDRIYFELVKLEKETGLIFPHSPTQNIYYNIVNKLEKVTHNHPMLSLAKTKVEKEIYDFIAEKEYVTMLKMDGLTCSLTYKDGNLVAAETRGNGTIGENILHNALVLPSIPKSIGIKDEVIVDGEIISTYNNFKKWENKYANPRNFAAGSIRLLNSEECAERGLTFVAWDRINAPEKTMEETLFSLNRMGFEVVPYLLNEFNIEALKTTATICNYPIDGLVVKYNNRDYGESLGRTSHHFNNGIAFKFEDDSVTSYLQKIDYEVSRNGILTAVAVFEEIELEGSTVSRASLHNMSMAYEILGYPYVGQEVEVVKQNMIIPQIISSVKKEQHESTILTPGCCPICGEPLELYCENESEVLMCNNLNCSCRIINQLDYFCGKKGLDIKGLSKATLEKLLNWGWINSLSDIFELKTHREDWIRKPGFGVKSVDNILNAVEASKENTWEAFMSALGIRLIGPNVVKELAKFFSSWNDFIDAKEKGYEFYNLPNFGYEKHKSLHSFNYTEAKMIVEKYMNFKIVEPKEEMESSNTLDGKTFVITGKLTKFKNRAELEEKIAAAGGKVTGSISKKTSYLINNDVNSDSAKNKAAKSAGIPIISEDDFIKTFGIV